MKRLLSLFLTIGLSVLTVVIVFAIKFKSEVYATSENDALESATQVAPVVAVPPMSSEIVFAGITRQAKLHTDIPERPNSRIVKYIVQSGDTAWSIAKKFNLKPETILWGNDNLSASAGNLRVGTELNILPVDGVLHTVQDGDTLERIELLHGTPIQEIIKFPGNAFDLASPYEIKTGQQLVIPNGRNPFVWEEPGPRVVAGMGRKSPGLYSGALVNYGTGSFIWPLAPPIVLTQGYWGGHVGIDIDTYFRQPIFAADSGTVIFSGWSTSGFGNLIIIDHGNGYWTYYGHNEANLVSVGQGVVLGQQIAESGSTGNSTGDHLDFRIRVEGGAFLNPLGFLP